MKPKPIRWIHDAGHAWLQVPIETCDGLHITHYSYENGRFAYLEEDCDAPTWLRAYGYDPRQRLNLPYTHVNGDWVGRRKYSRFGQKVMA